MSFKLHILALLFIGVTQIQAGTVMVIKSDGTDPTVFPNLQITHGNILFGVPMAQVFGLDVNNNFATLPDADRFPNDFHDFLAKNEFLALPNAAKAQQVILISLGDFNNPGGVDQSVARMTFTVPLLNPDGSPIGGFGPRWVVIQFGPNAGGAGGGGGGGAAPPCAGRAGAYLKPNSPGGLKRWAAFISGIPGLAGETPAQLRARVKAAIRAAKPKASASQLARYDKLVDDSKLMDPWENSVFALQNDAGVRSIDVELVFGSDYIAYPRLAEMLTNVTVAVTNDPNDAPSDPNNQPAGETLAGAGSADAGAGEMCSVIFGDVEAAQTSATVAATNANYAAGALTVVFNGGTIEDGGGAAQFLDIGAHSASLDDSYHLVDYDQGVGDTPFSLAERLTEYVNNSPFDGYYPYEAILVDNMVQIYRIDGEPIQSAVLRRTGESEMIEESVFVNPYQGDVVICDVIPWLVNNKNWGSTIAIFNNAAETDEVRIEAITQEGESRNTTILVPGKSVHSVTARELFPDISGYSMVISSRLNNLFTSFLTARKGENITDSAVAQAQGAPLKSLTSGLMFSYIPETKTSALVLVAPVVAANAPTKVTLSLFGGTGTPVATTEVILAGNRPGAFMIDELFGSTAPEQCTIKAVTANGIHITGTAFFFNSYGEPTTANGIPLHHTK